MSLDDMLADYETRVKGYGVGDPIDEEVQRQVNSIHETYPGDEPTGFLDRTIDVLSRGQYAAAGFASEILTNKLLTQPVSVFAEASKEAMQEFFRPDDRRSFSDVIAEKAPRFAHEYPLGHKVLGFIGDVALDPLTYITLGTGAGAKVGIEAAEVGLKGAGKVALSKEGRKVFQKLSAEELQSTFKLTDAAKDAHTKITRFFMNERGWDVEDAAAVANRTLEAAANRPDRALAKVNKKFSVDLDTADVFSFGKAGSLRAAEDRSLASLSKILQEDLARGSTALIDEGGIKWGGKTLVKGDKLGSISERMGIPQFKAWVGDTKLGTATRFAFNRNPKEIPPEIAKLERNFYRNLAEGERRMLQGFNIMFKEAPKDSRYAVGAALSKLDDMEQEIWGKLTSPMSSLDDKARYLTPMEVQMFQMAEEMGVQVPAKALQKIIGRHTEEVLATPALQQGLFDDAIRQAETAVGTRSSKSSKDLVKTLKDRKVTGLTDEEKSLMAAFRDDMQRFGRLENEGQIVHTMKQNYFPRYYEMARDPQNFNSMFGRLKAGVASTFSPAETRKFDTLATAQEAGFDPIYDLAQLYAMRVSDHYNTLAKTEFRDDLLRLVPGLEGKLGSIGSKAKTLEDFAHPEMKRAAKELKRGTNPADQQLGHILERVRFITRPMYDPLDTKMKNDALKKYDKLMGFFRASATVLRPAFGARNFVSNQFQMFLGGGLQGIRHANVFMDPRGVTDGLMLLKAHGDPTILKRMRSLRTVHGVEYTPEQVMQAAREYQIVRNVSIDGIGAGPVNNLKGARKITRELDRKIAIKQGLFKGVDSTTTDGMTALFSGSFNYWDVPAMLEDHARLTLFTNMLKSGYDTKSAAKFVETALFDYTHGLSQFETRVMRRVIPFYSFQRFAVPLVAKMTGRSLGRVPNAMKAGKMLMETWGKIQRGDQELTPAERAALPGFLLEQPRAFAGFEKDMKAKFDTFNNFSPLDVFAFIESDEETGAINWKESLLQGSIAQMTPFLKVPMEMAVNKNFFTGRTFDSSIKQGELDVDRLFGNLVAAATAQTVQATGGPASLPAIVAGRALGQGLANMAPNLAVGTMKTLLGYEEGIDPNTGKKTAYFSPYRLHMLTSVLPGLNEAMREARTDKTPVERTMRLLFGVSRQKRDLPRDAGTKGYFRKKQMNEKKAEYRRAVRNQQDATAQRKLVELRNFMQVWARESDQLASGPIRGPLATGIDEQGPMTLEGILGQ